MASDPFAFQNQAESGMIASKFQCSVMDYCTSCLRFLGIARSMRQFCEFHLFILPTVCHCDRALHGKHCYHVCF